MLLVDTCGVWYTLNKRFGQVDEHTDFEIGVKVERNKKDTVRFFGINHAV